ncbi:EAL domain-containing protein [Cupriavidus basilensis]
MKGSLSTLALHQAQLPGTPLHGCGARAHDKPAGPGSASRHRILVVEENPQHLSTTMQMFACQGDHHVEGYADGAKALQRLGECPFDLVVTGLNVAGADGIQIIQSLPASAIAPALVITSTAPRPILVGARKVAESLGIAVMATLPKPLTQQGVHAALGAYRESVKRVRPARLGNTPEFHRDALIAAMENGEMQAWFQPQYALVDGLRHAVEALVRWAHPKFGLLLPGAFLPAIEREGLEACLLQTMLAQTLAAQQDWQARGLDITVCVNLTTKLLDDPDLPDRLHAQVTAANGDPRRICFELTEDSMAAQESNYYAGACRLRMHGFDLAQDDFSSGFSSFYRLVATPFTDLKLDRSMIKDATTIDAFRAALSSVVQLGRKMGMTVIAEGVETETQLRLLQEFGCHRAQGFLISPAIQRDAIARFFSAG